MKNFAIIIVILLFSTSLYAQKVDVKNDKILVDGNPIATIVKEGCGFNKNCTFYVRNLQGKTLITVMMLDLYDPNEIQSSNPNGKIFYFRFSFADEKGVAEVAFTTMRAKSVAKIIVAAKLIKDNELDDNEVRNFVQAHGTWYSDRKTELNNPKQIIIINR